MHTPSKFLEAIMLSSMAGIIRRVLVEACIIAHLFLKGIGDAFQVVRWHRQLLTVLHSHIL